MLERPAIMRNSRRLEEGTINQESVVWNFREELVFKSRKHALLRLT